MNDKSVSSKRLAANGTHETFRMPKRIQSGHRIPENALATFSAHPRKVRLVAILTVAAALLFDEAAVLESLVALTAHETLRMPCLAQRAHVRALNFHLAILAENLSAIGHFFSTTRVSRQATGRQSAVVPWFLMSGGHKIIRIIALNAATVVATYLEIFRCSSRV